MYVYVLVDPNTHEIRYVGQTVQKLERRLAKHLAKPDIDEPTHKSRWIRKLLARGQRPRVQLLQGPFQTAEDMDAAEVYWIAHMRARGCPLTNITVGGDRPPPRRGSVASPETREKMRQAHLGKKQSPEAIEKTRQANIGRKRSPMSKEARAKISAALRARPPMSIETREKLSRARKGKPGKKPSQETRDKQSAVRRGRKHSPETLEKMRVRALEREAKKREGEPPRSKAPRNWRKRKRELASSR